MNLPNLLQDTTPSKAGELCALCKQSSKHRCGGCETVTYCSGEHQKEHWKQHRDKCRAYKVLTDDKVGRYGVATRTLEPGECVLTEFPVVIGPKPHTYVMCLGCYAPVDGSTLCSSCGWPVCGPKCQAAPCHANAECPVFKSARVRFQSVENCMDSCPQLNCVTPLRLLLAKESNPERWESKVKLMESHNEERRNTAIWENNQTNIVAYLRSACNLADRLILRTTVKIEKGSEIYTTCINTLNPTLLRRELLKKSKFIDCSCSRCSDPTELGTHMSSLKCNKCDPGLILSTDPLDPMAHWKCSHCEFCTPGGAVRRVFSVIQSELEQLEHVDTGAEAVQNREALWRKYRSVLHPKHAFLMTLRCSLSRLYGHAEGYLLDDLPDILLERKIEICRDILSVADVAEPGLSRLRGMTLYELHAPVMLFARSQWRYKEIDDKKLRMRLIEAGKYLKEAVDILKFEHPSSPEGMIAVVSEESLQQLRESIASLPDQ